MWQKIALCIDTFSLALGKLVAWLTLAMMLATSAVVILRYGLETGSVMLQESVFFMHAVVFMLGAAYTLQKDGHVRVDIFYQRLGPKGRSAIDLFGTLFLLLPFCVFMFWVSFPYVEASWGLNERSADSSLYLYPVKTLLLLMPATLALQGISEIIKSTLVLMGKSSGHPLHAQGGNL